MPIRKTVIAALIACSFLAAAVACLWFARLRPTTTDTAPAAARPTRAGNEVEHGNVAFDVSADGGQVVFSSADGDLYLLRLKSGKVTRLTQTDETETTPSFSPDGSTVVYAASAPGSDQFSLFIRGVDGNRVVRLTNDPQKSDRMPSYSQDGAHIAFARAHRHRPYSMGGWTWDEWDIYVMRADGSDLRRITHASYYEAVSPRLAADGKSLIYAAIGHGENGPPTIFRADLDGKTVPHPLLPLPPATTRTGAWATEPVLSSGGRSIAFISDRATPFHYDVLLGNSDCTNLQPLGVTAVSRYNQGPVFISGSGDIAFLAATGWNAHSRPIFSLWKIDTKSRKTRPIAGSGLFTAPLQWKPETGGSAEAKE